MEISIKSGQMGVMYFRASYPKMVYEDDQRTDKQVKNSDGMPLWSVKVEVVQGDLVRPEELFVVVPCPRDPAEGLQLNERVAFDDLRIISGSRRTGGRWEKFEAEKIVRMKRGA